MLTDTKARKAKAESKPYKLVDAEGLFLDIRPSGKKIWRYRFYVNKKEGMYTIGEYPTISLAQARKKRDWARTEARQGNNPNQTKAKIKLEENINKDQTFKVLAELYRDSRLGVWSTDYIKQFDSLMEDSIYPVIGHMGIATIKPMHILQIIEPVVHRGAPSIAKICRMHISKVFRLAAGRLLVESDPTHLLSDTIPKKPVKHFRTISEADIPKLFKAIEEYKGRRTALGVKLLLHTFLRGAELRKSKWKEINPKKRIWTIPAAHTKKRRVHLVPLSEQAVDILKELEAFYGYNPEAFIFPQLSDETKCMPKRSMDAAIEYMGFRGVFSLHGFRSAASTILNEYGWHPDAIERQLAHMEQKSERRAYNHAQYLDVRTEMMQWWSDYITRLK